MSDEELMLLELMTYGIDSSVAKEAGVKVTGTTVGDWLKAFDEKALEKLEQSDNDNVSAYMSGKDWAAAIRKMQSDEDLTSLKIVDRDDNVHAMCFVDQDTGKPYVAFQGTSGSYEWYDNALGLHKTDTQSQQEALDYIESLPYDNITVVGHSKGGNKAQYVTITSDKVDRCVSMDGQGFSQEFIDKYAAEIEARGGKITNISLDTDYVHILLFPIPGSDQVYCKGGNKAGLSNHSPGAYFHLYSVKVEGEDGEIHEQWFLQENEDGTPKLVITDKENEGIRYLHEFTCFVLNVMPADKQEQVMEYLGVILALSLDGGDLELDGKTYKQEDLLEFILSDQETLALVIAYIFKYAETYNLTEEEVVALFEAFGLGELLDEIMKALDNAGLLEKLGISTAKDIVRLLWDEIRDGKEDPIIETILKVLGIYLNKKLNGSVPGLDCEEDIPALWRNVEKEYTDIGPVNKRTANKNATIKGTQIYDYSQNVLNKIGAVMSSVSRLTSGSVSGWKKYAGEEWYGSLGVNQMIKGVNGYFDRIEDINSDCRKQINSIFEKVGSIDRNVGKSFGDLAGSVSAQAVKARKLCIK